MSHDSPPRQPLAPPFSRPTHPGPLPVISPFSEAGRPLRPTPYASAVIPHLVPATNAAESAVPGGSDAEMDSLTNPGLAEATGASANEGDSATVAEPDVDDGRRDLSDWPDCPDPGDERLTTKSTDLPEEVVAPPPSLYWGFGDEPTAPERPAIASLRDLPGDHEHPTGVPANPEAELESVDSASDYPFDTPWSSEAEFDWGTRDSEWEVEDGPTATPPAVTGMDTAVPAEDDRAGPVSTAVDEDHTNVAADALESVAAAIRRGELTLSALSGGETTPAILAAVLTALLAPAQHLTEPGGQDGPAARHER